MCEWKKRGKKVGKKLRGSPSEHEIQCALIDWCDAMTPMYPELEYIFAVPMGGFRRSATGAKLKREGAKKGVPDLLLLVPRRVDGISYIGFVMELKSQSGRVKPEQEKWLNFLESQGHYVCVAYDLQDAIWQVESYIQGGKV